MPLDLPDLIANQLQRPLPARSEKSPFESDLSYGRHFDAPAPTARHAAVLAVLYPVAGVWHLPLTVRPVHLADHPGQVSFPGGSIEPGETAEEAAVREFREELGVAAAGLRILGELSPVNLFTSDFAIRPFVASLRGRPAMQPNPLEVAEVLEISLAELRDPARRGRELIRRGRFCFYAPHIAWGGQHIWGATALMLGELLAVLAAAEAAS
ncbi:MAG TPA: CoA pyrophosphatase [Pirellulales bacterium]|jgi:8-oxo-dGTP pyrophosphatase MutT (NUDIX family)|nr:CoA pyrophosphatase [Pirellulales bacterium]